MDRDEKVQDLCDRGYRKEKYKAYRLLVNRDRVGAKSELMVDTNG